jgi:type VI secretion system secreted protein Hcp
MNPNPIFSRTLALVAPVTVLSLSQAGAAAVDYFLKLDGIKGESTDDKHKGEIDIESFSWGVTNAGATGGGGAGKATFKEFTVTKRIDRSSPKLMLACATGEKIPQLQFAVSREPTPGTPEGGDFYIITLSDILISSYSSAGVQGGADLPMESISFNFTKITYEYRPADGTEAVIESAEIPRDPTGNP